MASYSLTAGVDALNGTSGDDIFSAGPGAFSATDVLKGGAGKDVLQLAGDYSAGVKFGSNTMRAIEEIELASGSTYKLVTHDDTVGSGKTLTIKNAFMNSGSGSIHFDGSAETNGNFIVHASVGADVVKTGDGDDTVHNVGSGDVVSTGRGDDWIVVSHVSGGNPVINGGAGYDEVRYYNVSSVTLTEGSMKNVERIIFEGAPQFTLIMDDSAVAAGKSMSIGGFDLPGGWLHFYGGQEMDGSFDIYDTAGDDILVGGRGDDIFRIYGGGSEILNGHGGDDHFVFHGSLDSTDYIEGGYGYDSVSISGDTTAAFASGMFTGIERVNFAAGYDYNIAFGSDASEGSGDDALVISGDTLNADDTFVIDASMVAGEVRIYASAGDDLLYTGGGDDYVFDDRGGNDTVMTGAGNDVVYDLGGGDDNYELGEGDDLIVLGNTLTAADSIDGGEGDDTLSIGGNAYTNFVFGATTMNDVETLSLDTGFDYKLTLHDDNIGAGQRLEVNGHWLGAGDNLILRGEAETDGSFRVNMGAGDDRIYTGAGDDLIFVQHGGVDTVNAGGGNDTIWVDTSFTAADLIRGGSGHDELAFSGDFSAGLTLGADTVKGVEQFYFVYGHDYAVTMNDGNLAAGQTLKVVSSQSAGEKLTFDGSAETDGRFVLGGGDGADRLIGGAGADRIHGGGGKDMMTGGAGNDVFVFDMVSDSVAGSGRDVITDFATGDRIDLTAFSYYDDLSFIGTGAYSGAGNEVRYSVNGSNTFVRIDLDGDKVDDMQISLQNVASLSASDFLF